MATVKDLAHPGVADAALSSRKNPFPNSLAITKSDTTVYAPVLKSIAVGGAGAVAVVDVNDVPTVYTCIAGQQIEGEFKQVLSTGTAATGLVGRR